MTRTCTECKTEKPIDRFPLTRGKRFFRCQSCITAYNRQWREENRQRSNEIKRAWEQRNPEAARGVKQAYRDTERGAQVDAECKARRIQRERAAEGVFTIADERAMLAAQNWKCKACGVSIANGNYEADHIVPLVKGGSHWPANRQLLCPTCNRKKGCKCE